MHECQIGSEKEVIVENEVVESLKTKEIDIESKNKNKFHEYLHNIGDIFGRIIPRAFLSLPLYFRGSLKFASKRITLFSILVFVFIVWNSYKNIMTIGTIENIMQSIDYFKFNKDIARNYN